MNDRYRWDDKAGRSRTARPGDRTAGDQPDLTDKAYYGVGGGSSPAEPEQPSLQFGPEPAPGSHSRQNSHYAQGGFEPRGAHARSPLEERTFWDKAKDEVQAWMGDHEADERRKADHLRDEAKAAHGGDWQGHDDDTGWRDPVSAGKAAEADHASQPTEAREHRPGLFRDS